MEKELKTELKIEIPEGYEIDKENSTFEKIIFKKKIIRWRDNQRAVLNGYYIDGGSVIQKLTPGLEIVNRNDRSNYNVFATEALAKKALAMARISQILYNDERFGQVPFKGFIDEVFYQLYVVDWYSSNPKIRIARRLTSYWDKDLLVFNTEKQARLFLQENEDLLVGYFMLDPNL